MLNATLMLFTRFPSIDESLVKSKRRRSQELDRTQCDSVLCWCSCLLWKFSNAFDNCIQKKQIWFDCPAARSNQHHIWEPHCFKVLPDLINLYSVHQHTAKGSCLSAEDKQYDGMLLLAGTLIYRLVFSKCFLWKFLIIIAKNVALFKILRSNYPHSSYWGNFLGKWFRNLRQK